MKPFTLWPSEVIAMVNITRNITNCVTYRRAFAANPDPSSEKVDHFAGATAIQAMFDPLANSAYAAITNPSPSQTAHQSSFSQNSRKLGSRFGTA